MAERLDLLQTFPPQHAEIPVRNQVVNVVIGVVDLEPVPQVSDHGLSDLGIPVAAFELGDDACERAG